MDKRQFDNIFTQYHRELCKIAYRKVGDFQVAEDLVQELFLEFWRRKTKLSGVEQLSNYLRRSISLKCYDHLRSILKDDSQVIKLDGIDVEDVSTQYQDEENDERLQKLMSAIQKLPPKRKVVFILSRFDNKSYKEIAADLDISVKSVEKHISKALLQLRSWLGLFNILFLSFWVNFLPVVNLRYISK